MAGGRKAGNDRDYEFRLFDKSTGEMDRTIKLTFPSVTTIIGEILMKKQLLRWEARIAIDLVQGALSQLDPETLFVPDEDGFCLWDYITDPKLDDDSSHKYERSALQAWLIDQGLISEEVSKAAAQRGRDAHAYFEDAANAFIEGSVEVDEAEGHTRAQEFFHTRKPDNPFEVAIADWWLTRLPTVVASEKLLVSKRHDFAGTCDLFWYDDGLLTVTDLKTRKAGNGSYDSDHIQTGAYAIAYTEMTGQEVQQRTILLAQDDGTWDESTSWIEPETFLHLRAVYRALEERK